MAASWRCSDATSPPFAASSHARPSSRATAAAQSKTLSAPQRIGSARCAAAAVLCTAAEVLAAGCASCVAGRPTGSAAMAATSRGSTGGAASAAASADATQLATGSSAGPGTDAVGGAAWGAVPATKLPRRSASAAWPCRLASTAAVSWSSFRAATSTSGCERSSCARVRCQRAGGTGARKQAASHLQHACLPVGGGGVQRRGQAGVERVDVCAALTQQPRGGGDLPAGCSPVQRGVADTRAARVQQVWRANQHCLQRVHVAAFCSVQPRTCA